MSSGIAARPANGLLLIEGRPTDSSNDKLIPVVNPSTGKALFDIPEGSAEDIDRAVASARAAFDDGRWSEADLSFRKRTLHRFADLIATEAMALDVFDAEEMGKPISVKAASAASAASLMRFYAEGVDKLSGEMLASDRKSFVTQRRTPRGVVAAVTPWNFPVVNAIRKIAPALAAGNCVVHKPSELSTRSALRRAQLALAAGLPPGVLNVVPGLGETVGRALALHMQVDMLTFTGSTTVGKLMMQYSGSSNLKLVMCECGGKSPQIVFDDGIDLDAAGDAIARALLTNQGQICSVGSRLLVQRSVESRLVDRIVTRMANITIGDACDAATTFGPLASADQLKRVMGYVDTATTEGAQLVVGGKRVLQHTGGYFVTPTVYRDVPTSARIAQEEIFGPVLSVIPFDNESDALRIANDTLYGLMAYVWTADLSRGLRMAKGIRSSVIVNAVADGGEGAGYAFSFEPAGQSGIGVEGGLPGMESYLRRQSIWINHA